jgi:methylenetetrahydrofolate reductase (NADPH)
LKQVRIGDLYNQGKPVFSFEFFPPKSDAAADELIQTARDLKASVAPDFVSVTYGADGSTRTRTHECVTRIQTELGITAMAHLACMGHAEGELREVVARLVDCGIRNVLALRGDPPKDGAPADSHFSNATDLIGFLRSNFDIDIGAACYPETHPEASSPEADLDFAAEKAARGARFLITQLFFDNQDYLRFVDRARARGIGIPIVPGIMPITNVSQVERFTRMCGARIPAGLAERLNKFREDSASVMAVGLEHAITQCRQLLEQGAPGLHFYTLNKSLATRTILAALRNVR